MGDRVEPSDVFLAFTVDQGLNVVNAIEALNIPVVVCNAHRTRWFAGCSVLPGVTRHARTPSWKKI